MGVVDDKHYLIMVETYDREIDSTINIPSFVNLFGVFSKDQVHGAIESLHLEQNQIYRVIPMYINHEYDPFDLPTLFTSEFDISKLNQYESL